MGNFVVGSVTFTDPAGGLTVGTNCWQQVMLNERHVQRDEHTYPGYDLILTKKMGSRETFINGSIVIFQADEATCESSFQTIQAALVDNINDLTTPRGTFFERVKCERFQAGRMYRWDSKSGYIMFVDFSFKALQAQGEA